MNIRNQQVQLGRTHTSVSRLDWDDAGRTELDAQCITTAQYYRIRSCITEFVDVPRFYGDVCGVGA
jgi:hypothetical protein